MLGAGRYLLGVAEILALVAFAGVGARSLRRRLVPEFDGPSAVLAALVIALALLIVVAELLGSFGLFEPLPYLLAVGAAGIALAVRFPAPAPRPRSWRPGVDGVTVIALLLVVLLLVEIAGGVRLRLETGMTGFDSTWYHAPFAAGFFQSGSTWGLHFIAPQFLAWFYPDNGELFHAIGMGAFGRDLLSPLLNAGWMLGCVLAAWCIGRPYRNGYLAGLLVLLILRAPALADQAGEARNDVVGIFFLLAAVAIAVAAAVGGEEEDRPLSSGALLLAGLSAGLAAGTKLNFLLPCAVIVIGLAVVSPAGRRLRSLGLTLAGALVGGGYWYLRNLIHTGNPLPWFDHLGPISLPAPTQELGGRESHSVLGYLSDGSIWSEWFLPGIHHGFGDFWPVLGLLALAGLLLNLGRGSTPVLRVAALAGIASALAWLVASTSASGPEGTPQGFESGLRYLAGALALGAAMLATAPWVRAHFAARPHWYDRWEPRVPRSLIAAAGVLGVLFAIGAGFVVQRHYLRDRYADPTFTTPGLDAAFKWATPISEARIATTSTRQYPLFGTDLSNHVQFVGEPRPHGGFVAPSACRDWRRLINEGDYDYVVATRDRIEPGQPPYPASARWTESPQAKLILATPPTKVFKLMGPLDPAACPE